MDPCTLWRHVERVGGCGGGGGAGHASGCTAGGAQGPRVGVFRACTVSGAAGVAAGVPSDAGGASAGATALALPLALPSALPVASTVVSALSASLGVPSMASSLCAAAGLSSSAPTTVSTASGGGGGGAGAGAGAEGGEGGGGHGRGALMDGREVIVVPIDAAASAELRYCAWLEAKRQAVEALGRSQVGYVSLRAMDAEAYARFAEQFYPVHRRPLLLMDVRHNRGGNIDCWVLERLLRKAWLFFQPRCGGGYWNMPYAFRGHLAVLVDQQTQSNAEAFAEGFRRFGLGPVVGMRTWGGQIWMAHGQWLQDGGRLGIPEIGAYGAEGEWLIEGSGVEPDVRVDNPPHATFMGADAQLETAVRILLEKLEREPVEAPRPPPYPVRR